MIEKEYNREEAVKYAHEWAYVRNPKFYSYDLLGGDCTNFASQCIYSGSNVMNYDKIKGWYYINANNKSPSWTGVEFLYNFLVNNRGLGPFGKEVEANQVNIGDISQISFDGIKFSHTQVIVSTQYENNLSNLLVATHTFDSDYRQLSSYNYMKIRFIHIEGVRV